MKQKTKNTLKKSLTLTETWRTVWEFPDYEVSNLGNVRSLGRFKRWGNDVKWEDAIIMKPGANKQGYKKVVLRNAGIKKAFSVHSLVMLTFVGERPYKYDINHINGNPSDNRLKNLEYCTRSENVNHAYRIGLNKGKTKPQNKRIGFGL